MRRFWQNPERRREIVFAISILCLLPTLVVAYEAAIRSELNKALRANELNQYPRLYRQVGVQHPDISTYVLRANSTFDDIHINNLGFRGPDVLEPKPPGTIRIAILGHSAVFGLEMHDHLTVPARFAERMAGAYPGCTIDYVSVSGPGYTHRDFAWLLKNAMDASEVDHIVIIHHGATARSKLSSSNETNKQRERNEAVLPVLELLKRFQLYWLIQNRWTQSNPNFESESDLRKSILEELAAMQEILALSSEANLWYFTFFKLDRAHQKSMRDEWREAIIEPINGHPNAVLSDNLEAVPMTRKHYYSLYHYTPEGAALAAELMFDKISKNYPNKNSIC